MAIDKSTRDIVLAVEGAIGAVPRSSTGPLRVTLLPPDTLALAGEVRTLEDKEEAGRLAASVARGWHVENDLTVAVNRPERDRELEREAAERLADQGLSTVGAQVRGGIAHLVGAAENLATVDRAHRIVASVPGIREIRTDHVLVAKEQIAERVSSAQLPATEDTAIVADLDEASIVDRVEAALALQSGRTVLGNVRVYARHNTVVLEGTVKTTTDREQAERLARGVPGVSHVRNLLVCQDGSAGWDERLEAEIRHRLGRPRDHASPVDLKVFVAAGAVYLFGTADVPEQVDVARNLVREVAPNAPVYSEVQIASRHYRPAKGAGRAVEEGRRTGRKTGRKTQG